MFSNTGLDSTPLGSVASLRPAPSCKSPKNQSSVNVQLAMHGGALGGVLSWAHYQCLSAISPLPDSRPSAAYAWCMLSANSSTSYGHENTDLVKLT